VYLHVGEPKTGTTFVQHVLWDNRAALAARGVVLPGYSERDHSRASRDLREAPRLASDPADRWIGEWDVLTTEALRAPKTAVISNELLVACTPGQADRAVRSLFPADVHIILTARDIASLLAAEWQESVKCGGIVSWEEWLDGVMGAESATDRRRRSWFWTVHGTLANLEMWSSRIPPDHVHVITVPRDGPADTLWVRFASVLGIEPVGVALPAARVNPSLGMAEAEFLRRLNKALPREIPDWFHTRNIKRILGHDVFGSQARQVRLALPPWPAAWAREQSETLAAGLRDSKYHIVGDLTDLLSQPATGRYVGSADLPAQPLLDAAVTAAAALANHAYQERCPPKRLRQSPPGLRRKVSKLEWAVLNGSWTRRLLRNNSHLAAVRRLRVRIWLVLMHPSRHRPQPRLLAGPHPAGQQGKGRPQPVHPPPVTGATRQPHISSNDPGTRRH
jgi:hypothetical protein